MNDVKDELLRLGLRRELTPDEQLRVEAVLAAHPELRGQWEQDRLLAGALNQLPETPLASNFTARVMGALDVAERRAARANAPGRWFGRWASWFKPRLSWVAVLLLAGGLAVYQHRAAKRQELGHDIRGVVQGLASIPDPKILQDFDAINQLRQVAAVGDDQLLVILQ